MKNLINHSYNQVLENIKISCLKSNRDPKSVNVIAICKRQPFQKIIQAADSMDGQLNSTTKRSG